jgi:predicted patatin/cPLA2 family phospholipase
MPPAKSASSRADSNPSNALHGVNPAAAVSAILERAARRKHGDFESDGRKLGLVIEGGAMRSVYSAGGAVALARLGFTDLFDEVYATSAGVMNASYFLSDQPDIGITVYYESCTSRLFMNPLRLWKVLDIDYLFDQVITIAKPLDVDKVMASRSKFFVALIDKGSGEGLLAEKSTTGTPWVQVLKAATSMPVFYNRTVNVDGRPCMDGGLAIPFPLEQAIANGCTDLLVLLSRPSEYVSPAPTWTQRRLFDLICARGSAALMRVYNNHHTASHRARDLAFGRIMIAGGHHIATICTDAEDKVHRTTADPDALREAALRYGRRTLRIFGADPAKDFTLPRVTIAGQR